jgi:transposase-like protein
MSEKIVQLNEEVIKGQLKELVRGSVEETLNELLEAEAEKLTQAARYERNEQRQRPLQPQPYHHFWGCHTQDAQAQGDLL